MRRLVTTLSIAAALGAVPVPAATQGPEVMDRFEAVEPPLSLVGAVPASSREDPEYTYAQWGALFGIGLGVLATYLIEKDIDANMMPGGTLILTVPAGMLLGAAIGYIIDYHTRDLEAAAPRPPPPL